MSLAGCVRADRAAGVRTRVRHCLRRPWSFGRSRGVRPACGWPCAEHTARHLDTLDAPDRARLTLGPVAAPQREVAQLTQQANAVGCTLQELGQTRQAALVRQIATLEVDVASVRPRQLAILVNDRTRDFPRRSPPFGCGSRSLGPSGRAKGWGLMSCQPVRGAWIPGNPWPWNQIVANSTCARQSTTSRSSRRQLESPWRRS